MIDVLDKAEKTELIGRDFLVWLWFRSDANNGIVELEDGAYAEIRFEGRITLETETDQALESVTCSGNNPRMKEARFALTEHKKVTRASISLVLGDDQFTFSLDSRWLNYKSLKTPKVVQDDREDPEGLFYEKAGLIEKAVSTMDAVFLHFIRLRLSSGWEAKELPAIRQWSREGGRRDKRRGTRDA